MPRKPSKRKEASRKYYLEHKEQIRVYQATNREHIREQRRRHYAENRNVIQMKIRAYQEKNKEKANEWHRRANHDHKLKLKLEVIAAYGGACQCCGETIPEFLSAEHIGQWGAQHRREVGWRAGGTDLYRWLKKNGFPKDKFGLLCMNCQFATKHGKPCPHTKIDVQSVLMGVAC